MHTHFKSFHTPQNQHKKAPSRKSLSCVHASGLCSNAHTARNLINTCNIHRRRHICMRACERLPQPAAINVHIMVTCNIYTNMRLWRSLQSQSIMCVSFCACAAYKLTGEGFDMLYAQKRRWSLRCSKNCVYKYTSLLIRGCAYIYCYGAHSIATKSETKECHGIQDRANGLITTGLLYINIHTSLR